MPARKSIVRLLQSVRLNRIVHRVYYGSVHGFDTANRDVLPALDRCFEHVAAKGTASPGAYLEFGLFKGYSFWYAQSAARRLGLDSMRFFGFDSFAGLPDIGDIDRTENDAFYKGQYACSKEDVVRNLDSNGVDWERTFLIEGYYATSLNPALKSRHRLQNIAIVLIDCDLYESTAQVLEFVEDLMRDGTIVMFDDWNCFNGDDDRGQRRALREFLSRHFRWRMENFFSYGIYGQVFVARERRN